MSAAQVAAATLALAVLVMSTTRRLFRGDDEAATLAAQAVLVTLALALAVSANA